MKSFARFASQRSIKVRRRNTRCLGRGLQLLEDRRVFSIGTALVESSGSVAMDASIIASPVAAISGASGVLYPVGAPLEAQSQAAPSGYGPQQVRHAYGLDSLAENGTALDGAGQTIAIVDAYDDPTISSDLAEFDAAFGLPAANFQKYEEYLQTPTGRIYPTADADWSAEISLDVEWAHAMAPGATIMLVEALNNSAAPDGSQNLYDEVNWARQQPGVSVVSMSFGTADFNGENAFDGLFTTPAGHQPVTFVAASGDRGNPGYAPNSDFGEYPALSPNVVGVGSTELYVDANGNYGEYATSYSGGGFADYESEPGFQSAAGISSNGHRVSPDVAFLGGDSSFAMPICDSYAYGSQAPWNGEAGTSASAPQFAGLLSMANEGRSLSGKGALDGPSQTLPLLYELQSSFHDITTGGNPAFSAGPRYDAVTGLGTPIGNILLPQLINGGLLGLQAGDLPAANSDVSLGSTFSGELFTFSDPNGNFSPSIYNTKILWGDGTASAGTVEIDSNGKLGVFGSHVYTQAGEQQVLVNVAAPNNSGTAIGAFSVDVIAPPMQATGGFTVSATEGTAFSNQVVASFVDPTNAGSYTANVDFGDGSSAAGQVVSEGGDSYEVLASHTYASAQSPETITVTITRNSDGYEATVMSSAVIAGLPLEATGDYTILATEGVAFSQQLVVTFVDPTNGGSYTANVDFGDGSSAAGQVVSEGGDNYEVLASHIYASGQSPETITVTITRNSDGDRATAVSHAVVAVPSIQVTGGFAIQATAGVSFSGQEVATFIDTASSSPASSYSASIDWGDGETTAGTIVVGPSGGFDVLGGHRYAAAGLFRIEVYVHEGSAPDVSAASHANVVSGGKPGGDAMPNNLPAIAEQLTHDSDYYGAFVTWAYQQFLGRTPDASGLSYWISKMQGGLTDEQLETTFISTPEYIADHGGSDVKWVIGMYHDLLGRTPDADGLAYWTSQIESGTSEYNIALGFATSPEREAIVVTNDYNKYLLRAPSQSDINGWVNLFEHGGLENEDVVAGFIASQEYYNNGAKGEGGRTAWVDSVFEDLYDFQPTSNELSYWLAEMNGSTFF